MIGQAGAGVGRSWIGKWNAVSKDRGAAPDRTERTQTGAIENFERVEIGINGFRALEMQDSSMPPLLQAILYLSNVPHTLGRALRLILQTKQQCDHSHSGAH